MKKVWIFGGSFCSGYQHGAEARDWIAQLGADVTVWACNPQSQFSQYLMLTHALEHHCLERLQSEPDLIIYDYPPVNRVDVPGDMPSESRTMLNYIRYHKSRTGHAWECGCVSDPAPHWKVRSLTRLPEWHQWDDTPELQQFTETVKHQLISGELPDQKQIVWTQRALDLITLKQIPVIWFSVHNTDHELISDHLNTYCDIMTLDGTVPTQSYNSKTANHLSILQNILWAKHFRQFI